MSFVQNLPLFCIVFTLFSGVICAVLSPKAARNVCYGILIFDGTANVVLLSYVLKLGDYYVYRMGHFPAPWGNEIRIGVLEALLAVCFSIGMLLSLMGGMKHIFEDVESTKTNLYFSMMNLLFVSMLALIYTNDLFTGYVFVEINTITACAIIMLRNKKETLVSTFRYLTMSTLGSGMFLMGINILYDITGHLLMSNIHESVKELVASGKYAGPLEVVIALFCVGLATKSALYPFHSQLPDAYSSATSASSAVLSGLVLKAYIILLIKIIYRVIGIDVFRFSKGANVLFVLGILGMIMGSLHAMTEKNLNRMIAYSSVAQIGYIYMGIGLGSTAGMVAAVFQILAHAATKTMLFDAAGGLMEVSGGSKSFKRLKGAARRNPTAGFAFVIGSLSMIGIPLFAGFISKMYLATASIGESRTKMLLGLTALAISTVLNALYFIPAIMVLYSRDGEGAEEKVHHADPSFVISMIIFVVINFVLGCMSTPIIGMISSGFAMFD